MAAENSAPAVLAASSSRCSFLVNRSIWIPIISRRPCDRLALYGGRLRSKLPASANVNDFPPCNELICERHHEQRLSFAARKNTLNQRPGDPRIAKAQAKVLLDFARERPSTATSAQRACRSNSRRSFQAG